MRAGGAGPPVDGRAARCDPAPGQGTPPEAPGKPELVVRGIAAAGLGPGARVLDVGCGLGSSVELMRRSLRLRAIGLDLAARSAAACAAPRLRADARCLPLRDGALDGVLLECVLSLVLDRTSVLRECARALVPAGRMVLTDLYAREGREGAAREGAGPCGAELLPREVLVGLLASGGFEVFRWEDHSGVLKEYLFRLIMRASPVEWPCPGGASRGQGEAATPAQVHPGYCLIVARRRRG